MAEGPRPSGARSGSLAKSRLSTSAAPADSACPLLNHPAVRLLPTSQDPEVASLQASRTPRSPRTLPRGEVPGGQGRATGRQAMLNPSTPARALTYCVTATYLADKGRRGGRGRLATPPPPLGGAPPLPGPGCWLPPGGRPSAPPSPPAAAVLRPTRGYRKVTLLCRPPQFLSTKLK